MESKYKAKTQYGNWIIYKNDKALSTNHQVLKELQTSEVWIHELLKLANIGSRVLTDIINGDVDEWIINNDSLNADQLLDIFTKTIEKATNITK